MLSVILPVILVVFLFVLHVCDKQNQIDLQMISWLPTKEI